MWAFLLGAPARLFYDQRNLSDYNNELRRLLVLLYNTQTFVQRLRHILQEFEQSRDVLQ